MISERQHIPAPLIRSDCRPERRRRYSRTSPVLLPVCSASLMILLYSVEHLAFGAPLDGEGALASIEATSGWQRVLPLILAGLIGGPVWFLLRKLTPGKKFEVDEVLWTGESRLSLRRSLLGTSVISEVTIGLGASLGREAALKLMGAVMGVPASPEAAERPEHRYRAASPG